MNLQQIEQEWSKDTDIDLSRLDLNSIEIPKLHSKYYGLFLRARARLYDLTAQQEKLEIILTDYYKKNLSSDELEEYGLGPFPERRILNADVPKHVAKNEDNIKLKWQIGMQNEKVDFLKSILHQINQRSFVINNAIKFQQFQAGADH